MCFFSIISEQNFFFANNFFWYLHYNFWLCKIWTHAVFHWLLVPRSFLYLYLQSTLKLNTGMISLLEQSVLKTTEGIRIVKNKVIEENAEQKTC